MSKYVIEEKKDKKLVVLVGLFVLFILMFNTSSLVVSSSVNPLLYTAVYYIGTYIFLLSYSFYINKPTSFSTLSFIISVLLTGLILVNMIVNSDYNILNFLLIFQISTAILIANFISFNKFAKAYIYSLAFISFFSLIIMYIIIPFFPSVATLFPVRYNDSGLLIRNYIFTFHFENHVAAKDRNTGIFREMGVFQFYINFALIMLIFIVKRIKYRKIIIFLFIVTILTTFSSAGFIQLIFTLMAFLITSISLSKKKIKEFVGIVSIIVPFFFIVYIFIPEFSLLINNAFNKFDADSPSLTGRSASIIANLKSWTLSPFIGNGIVEGDILANNLHLNQFSGHNTSTSTSYLSIYGIFFTTIITIIYFSIFLKIKANFFVRILLCIGFIISINSQRLMFDQLFYIIIFTSFFANYEKGEDES